MAIEAHHTEPGRARRIVGWLVVVANLVVASSWALWGTIEAFHEGWFSPYLWRNLLAVLAYTGPAWVTVLLTLFMIRKPVWGSIAFLTVWGVIGFLVLSMLRLDWTQPGSALFSISLAGLGGAVGLLGWYGRPEPIRWAVRLTWGVPLSIFLLCAAEPAWRIAHRYDDGMRGLRTIEGNEIQLQWAPQGPGCPGRSTSWDEAKRICRYLSEDGTKLMPTPQGVWRLPTTDELVRSMTRNGRNAGGRWTGRVATYETRPDKETPLWDPTSEVIYYWTMDEAPKDSARIVVYHGGVFTKAKKWSGGTQGFRAVRDIRNYP